MRPGDAKRASSRQRPISCHFCRTRCSRRFPCPNCTTRGISCQLQSSQTLPVGSRRSTENDLDKPNSELLVRLQKLEDIVIRKCAHASSDVGGFGRVSPAPSRLHIQHQRPATIDSDWLERECMSQPSSKSICPDEIVFRTCPVQQITKYASYFFPAPSGPFSPGEPTKCIWLPQREESRVLVEKYLREITHIHHVVHLPSIRILLDAVYDDLSQSHIKPGHVALLLSILASATYSWNIRDPDNIFSTVEEADSRSASWVKATLDVLEYSSRTTSGALEDVQAIIIISFVVCSLEGMSSRYRNLISTAISSARELLLHRIDHPANSAMMVPPPTDSVQAEIGRRVWWYLVATDWMLSGYAGSQERIYVINPSHMVVNIPKNIRDEDLVDGMVNVELPLTQPTSMSYCIQRIRLAYICREFTDQVSFSDSDPEGITYNRVVEFDAKFIKFLDELPHFFRLDGATVGDVANIDLKRDPGVIIQRYILHSLIHARRCKLHAHYLARGSLDPAYACSRDICLEAARTIIRMERLLEREDIPFVLTRLKCCGLIFCIVMAIMVLVLDICLNKDAADAELRKAEVVDACSILEDARGQSAMAAKLLDSLMSILPKHHVSLEGINRPQFDPRTSSGAEDGLSTTPTICESTINQRNPNHRDQNLADVETSYFDEIWQSFNGSVDTNMLDWSSLLSDLDTRFGSG